MNESVAIIGGGVAGLTAAHELVKRGFKVQVYERRPMFGGKAASYRVAKPGAGTAAPDGPPGEHGFRFFPGWYRHLSATLEDIPYQDKKTLYRGQTVADNLVQVRTNRLTWLGRPSVDLPLQVPRNASEAVNATQFLAAFRELGLSAGEVTLFFRKLFEVAAMSEAARLDKLENISWWDFLECSAPARSQAYKDFIRATTRTMVAAKAEEASAYTIGRVAVRTFLDTLTSVDRVLNGPTNEVWIDPWVEHLTNQGVTFHREMELDAIRFDAKSRCVHQVLVEPVVIADVRRLRALIARGTRKPDDVGAGDVTELLALMRGLQDPRRFASIVPPELIQGLPPILEDACRRLTAIWDDLAKARQSLKDGQRALATRRLPARAGHPSKEALRTEIDALKEYVDAGTALLGTLFVEMNALGQLLSRIEAVGRQEHAIDADYFVLALPLEQLAYHVDRSQMLTFLAPELSEVVELTRHMDWMSGIQFYLNCHVSLAPGHLVGMDSPWALTAIDSTRFWKNVDLPAGVKTVVSVDISAWDRRGLHVRKEAFNCTDDEIATEVWHQLKQLLNRKEQPDILRDEMLADGPRLERNRSYHLDESVVDLRDRKKQAFYERARGVRFNTLDLVREGERTDGGAPEERYMWGPRLRFNVEPLLVNRPGSHQLRPEAITAISNLFLAGDYVRTDTDLASMEGANEAARRAVNGILKLAGSREAPCELFSFSPGRQVAGAVITIGGALRGIEGAAMAMSGMQDRVWKRLAMGVMRAQRMRELP